MERHHAAGFVIFTATVCAAGVALVDLRAALICDAIFSLVVALVWLATRHKAQQRRANFLRSTVIEIDGEKVAYSSSLRNVSISRSEIVEAWFSRSWIRLQGKSRRARIYFPREIDGFDKLPGMLEEWLPQQAIRRNSPPSTVWPHLRLYGTWAAAALLLFVAMASQTRAIAVPTCVLAATAIAWYFAWCGRKISERKWKILLPLSGYFMAATLLGKAFVLWVGR